MGHSGGSYAHYYGPGFKFSCVQISKSPNSLLLFTDYTPHSTVHSPSSSCFLSSKAKQAAMSDNEERWESLPAEIPNHIKYIIICTSFSKTWKSKSKTQLSFPPISTTPITKAKTSSSSGWQKKKKKRIFLLMISSQMTITKKSTHCITKMMMTQMLIFTQLLMGLCIGLLSRQILITNLIFLFWCSIWGMKCSAKYFFQNFQLMGIPLPCFSRSMKVSVWICGWWNNVVLFPRGPMLWV